MFLYSVLESCMQHKVIDFFEIVIAKVRAQSYFIERNKNHMIPVYLKTNFRGQRKLTLIRKIEGNIWVLNDELTAHLKSVEKRPIGSQVDEVRGLITVKGDHVYNINQFLLSKGF